MRAVILGCVAGVLAVTCWIGASIGWAQSHLWPAWLSVPLGAAMGPMFLFDDIEILLEGAPHRLTALPQALLGGLVGALLGWLVMRLKRKG